MKYPMSELEVAFETTKAYYDGYCDAHDERNTPMAEDQLAVIKDRHERKGHRVVLYDDMEWLVAETEHLRAELSKPRKDRAFRFGMARAANIAKDQAEGWREEAA